MARTAPTPTRRQHTDLDRWRAYQHYVSTGQFTKTTAKACLLPVGTLKAWIKKWDFDPDTKEAKNPPAEPSKEELERLGDEGDNVDEWKSLRKLAMNRLREVIPKTNSADQLGRIIKDLSERIDRSEGLHDVAPSTVQVNIRLEQARAEASEMIDQVREMLGNAAQRAEIIYDAEEPLELPPGAVTELSESGSEEQT
jgi:transposase-like protein